MDIALGFPGVLDILYRICRKVIRRCKNVRANRIVCMKFATRVQRLRSILKHFARNYSEDDILQEPSNGLQESLAEIQNLLENEALPLIDSILLKGEPSRRASLRVLVSNVRSGEEHDEKLRILTRDLDSHILDVNFVLTGSLHAQRLIDQDLLFRELSELGRRYQVLERLAFERRANSITVQRIREVLEQSVEHQIRQLSEQVSALRASDISKDRNKSGLCTGQAYASISDASIHREASMDSYFSSAHSTEAEKDNFARASELRATFQKEVVPILNSIRNGQCEKVEQDAAETLVYSLLEPWRVSCKQLRIARYNGGPHLLGRGGFGQVYKGIYTDERARNHKVAIKILQDQYITNESQRNDFIREVTILYDLEHPCVVRFIGAILPDPKDLISANKWFAEELEGDSLNEGSEESYFDPLSSVDQCTTAIVTELMHCSIHQAREKKFISWNDTVADRVLLDVAEAMRYIHSRNVVHLDLKPQNILVRVRDGKIDGRAKIADFGVSQVKRDSRSRTMTGAAGTRDYMAPELMRSDRPKLLSSSDVWSFGVLICELLNDESIVGTMPDHEIINAAQNGTLHLRFSEHLKRLADERMRVVAKMCLVDRNEVRPNFCDLCDALSKVLHSRSTQSFNEWFHYKQSEAATLKIPAETRLNEPQKIPCREQRHSGIPRKVAKSQESRIKGESELPTSQSAAAQYIVLQNLFKPPVLSEKKLRSDASICCFVTGITERGRLPQETCNAVDASVPNKPWNPMDHRFQHNIRKFSFFALLSSTGGLGGKNSDDRKQWRYSMVACGLVGHAARHLVRMLKEKIIVGNSSPKPGVCPSNVHTEYYLARILLFASASEYSRKALCQSELFEAAELINIFPVNEAHRVCLNFSNVLKCLLFFCTLNTLTENNEGYWSKWASVLSVADEIMAMTQAAAQGKEYCYFKWFEEEVGMCLISACTNKFIKFTLIAAGAIERLVQLVSTVTAVQSREEDADTSETSSDTDSCDSSNYCPVGDLHAWLLGGIALLTEDMKLAEVTQDYLSERGFYSLKAQVASILYAPEFQYPSPHIESLILTLWDRLAQEESPEKDDARLTRK